jgi:hypothetical protein
MRSSFLLRWTGLIATSGDIRREVRDLDFEVRNLDFTAGGRLATLQR